MFELTVSDLYYRSSMVNLNMANSKLGLIQIFPTFVGHFIIVSCLNGMLIRIPLNSKKLATGGILMFDMPRQYQVP